MSLEALKRDPTKTTALTHTEAERRYNALKRAEQSATGPQSYDAYHAARFAYVTRLARKYVPNRSARVLDIGRSRLSVLLAELYDSITTLGFEIPDDDPWGETPHIVYDLNRVLTMEPLPVEDDDGFDLIVIAEVIEHLTAPAELVFLALQTVLRPGGIILCQTPNAAALHKRLQSVAGRNPYERLRIDSTNPGHYREYTRDELSAAGRNVGLDVLHAEYRNDFGKGGRAGSSMRRGLFSGACALFPAFSRGHTVIFKATVDGPEHPAPGQATQHLSLVQNQAASEPPSAHGRASRRAVLLSGVAAAGAVTLGSSADAAKGASAPLPAGSAAPSAGIGIGIADGRSHPLSERYATLEDAQVDFPHAVDLADEIDWCAIQGAINDVAARGGGAVHLPNSGAAYVLNRGLKLNPATITLRGDGTVLNFASLTSGSAIRLDGGAGPMWGHERHVVEGLDLIGPGMDVAGVSGLQFQTDVIAHSSRAQIRDCVVRDFYSGVLFGDRAYIISFHHVSVWRCTFAVHCPYALRDAGENVSFHQCSLFGSKCLILNTAGFELKFVNSSLVFADRVVWDNNGLIDFVTCRIEVEVPKIVPFHNGVGRVNFIGGLFQINGSGKAKVEALFASNDAAASVHMVALRGWNWRTTSGRIGSGPGRIYWFEGTEIESAPNSVGEPT